MDKLTDQLDKRIKIDMSFAEWARLTAMLSAMSIEEEKIPPGTVPKVLDFSSTFIARLTDFLTSPEPVRKALLGAIDAVTGGKLARAVKEVAEEIDDSEDKEAATKRAIERLKAEREAAMERLMAEAEQIAKEASEGTKNG